MTEEKYSNYSVFGKFEDSLNFYLRLGVAAETFAYVLVIVLGAVFGSFATVLADRIPQGISIVRPRSFCPNCKSQLTWIENIPVLSFLLLGGKCRNCRQKISFTYPLIEISMVILYLISFIRHGISTATLSLMILATLSVPLFTIDIKYKKLPDLLTLSGFGLGILISLTTTLLSNSLRPFKHSIIYSIASAIFFLIIYLVSKGGMGFGDVKLAMMIGSLTYFLSWKPYVSSYYLAFGLGSIYGLIMMVLKKAGRKTAIPFGPFMLIGIWLIIFLNY